MDNHKYWVKIFLSDGQNFAVPPGSPDKVESTVFAEARFGNDSVLRSDPIKLINSNPEFDTELVWQLDKKSLHQLRVERKAIKLQIFMQTKKLKKAVRHPEPPADSLANETHKVELIGYTILDIRSAQQIDQPKLNWCPLLNPKFRKSSYNRPAIQLAISLNRLDDESTRDDSNQFSSISSLPEGEQGNNSLESISNQNGLRELNHADNTGDTTRLYTTCLDTTANSDQAKNEIIDNDIIIRSRDGIFYIYDAKKHNSSLEDCKEKYRLKILIPFSTGLDLLFKDKDREDYFFSINLFGSSFKTRQLENAKEVTVDIMTAHPATLATYFELNSDLDIRLHDSDKEVLGLSTVPLNQLCSLDLKCRSIEGIFALQSQNDLEQHFDALSPSIGVSVVLEKVDQSIPQLNLIGIDDLLSRKDCGDYIRNYRIESINDTHQITFDETNPQVSDHEILMEDHRPGDDDHHYCFTIDLKKFSYTPSQRLIPMLRELVIQYTYHWFGYVDKITTDASVPINATSSIIVSGFCEFNFASTSASLLTALSEIPLNLEIVAVDETRLKDLDNDCCERVVATCSINLAKILGLNVKTIDNIGANGLFRTSLEPIFALDGDEVGELQIYLCLKDLGKLSMKFKTSDVGSCDNNWTIQRSTNDVNRAHDVNQLNRFISETKNNLETWKEESLNKLEDAIHFRNDERLKRMYQRIEARDVKRDQEFKKKLVDLINLEKKFLNSLSNVDQLEKMLVDSIEHLKTKNATLDDRLNLLEEKMSQVISKQECERPTTGRIRNDTLVAEKTDAKQVPFWARTVQLPPAKCLVRRPSEGSATTRQTTVRRATSSVPSTGQNGISARVRSNSAKLNLSKETLDKLTTHSRERLPSRENRRLNAL